MNQFVNNPLIPTVSTKSTHDGGVQVAPQGSQASQISKQRSVVTIHGKHWYFRLKRTGDDPVVDPTDEITTNQPSMTTEPPRKGSPKRARGLMDDYKLEQIDGKLVISMITPTNIRLYTLFDSYIHFAGFVKLYPPERRTFYEVALGEFPQKPRYDLDINVNDVPPGTNLDELGDQLKDTVIELTTVILAEKEVRLDLTKDVLVFTSHGPTKRSFHIVINNYSHYFHKEARALYDQVMARFPEAMKPYARFVDSAVYSSKQQFRIVGSQKAGSGRPKKFLSTWTYKGQPIEHVYIEKPENADHEFMLQLEESLLTHTSSCYLLPSFIDPTDEGLGSAVAKARYEMENIPLDLANKALEMCAARGGVTMHDRRFPYILEGIEGIKGGIVCLKRRLPSKCQICSRVHEHENPFLIVVGEGTTKSVYFCCRRAPMNKKLFIGKLEDLEALPPPQSAVAVARDNWLTQNITEKLMALANVEPERPTIVLPVHKQVDDPNHSKTIVNSSMSNMPWGSKRSQWNNT